MSDDTLYSKLERRIVDLERRLAETNATLHMEMAKRAGLEARIVGLENKHDFLQSRNQEQPAMRTVLDNLDELTVRRQLARAAADHSMLESLLELIERNKACADLKQDDDGDRDEN